MNMCNLIDYNENYWRTSGSFWPYYRDQPALDDNVNITDFPFSDDTSLLNVKKCNWQDSK